MFDYSFNQIEGFDLPIPALLWRKACRKLTDKLKNQPQFDNINWERDIFTFRKDLNHLYDLGVMNVKADKPKPDRVRLTHNREHWLFSKRYLGWMVLYPEVLLSGVPVPIVGRALPLFDNEPDTVNPTHLRPSKFWGLPDHVYQWFDDKYGPDLIKKDTPRNLQTYMERREYNYRRAAKTFGLDPNYYSIGQRKLSKIQL